MPPTVLGYYLLVLIGSQGPIGAWLLQHFGIRLIFTWQAAVIAAMVVSFPLVFKARACRLRDGRCRSSRTRRARWAFTRSRCSFGSRCRWPGAASWPGLLLSFARALGEFGATLMVAGSIPGQTQTLSIAVYEAVQAGQDDTANFLVVLTSITCIAVLLAAGRLVPGRVAPRD